MKIMSNPLNDKGINKIISQISVLLFCKQKSKSTAWQEGGFSLDFSGLNLQEQKWRFTRFFGF